MNKAMVEIGDEIEFTDFSDGNYEQGFVANDIRHGSIPEQGRFGIIRKINGKDFLIEYSKGIQTMKLSFREKSFKVISKRMIRKYQVGDIVNVDDGSSYRFQGMIGEISDTGVIFVWNDEHSGSTGEKIPRGYKYSWSISNLSKLTLVKSKNTIMKKIGNMMKKLLDNDTQALVKSGYINGDLELTDAGVAALNSVAFDKFKTELVALANEEVAEQEKEAAKK